MTIKELKQIIQDLPDGMDVFMDERLTEFKFGLVNSAKVKEIGFQEDPYSEIMARVNVLVLMED